MLNLNSIISFHGGGRKQQRVRKTKERERFRKEVELWTEQDDIQIIR